MLGTIFENLLAEIDPDTEKVHVKRQVVSIRQEIVDYGGAVLVQYLNQSWYTKMRNNLELLKKVAKINLILTKTNKILEALSDVKI